MNKMIKWIGIIVGSMAVLIILVLIIVPFFFDIQKFKPTIEQQITKAAGRTFTIGGDIKLSLFPLAGLSFSDVHLGNPDGFTEKDFISVKSLDVKVKFLPLLSKDIQVKRFVIIGPRIVLEKTKNAGASWQGIGKKDAEVEKAQEGSGMKIKGLSVAEFSVSEGELLYIDQATGTRKEIKALTIELKDVSLERPLKLAVSANVDGKTVSIEGEAGPIGKEPGKGAMTVDLSVKAMDALSITIQGSATDVASKPKFDLNISAENFSPRDLINGLMSDFKLNTKDPEVLKTMSARMKIKGSTENIDISDGTIELDQSKMTFSASVKEFAKPDLVFNMNLDKLDADRYLPPAGVKQATGTQAASSRQKKEKTDYGPLRKLVLDSAINIGELTIKGAQVKDIQAKIKSRDGIFNIDSLSLNAYEGRLSSTAVLNVSGDIPTMQADMDIKGLQLRKAVNGLMPDLKLNTKDPDVLKTLSARIKMKGTTEKIDVSNGTIELDQSRITFSATAKDFSRPDLAFKMNLDKIDADRYLPPVKEKQAAEAETAAASQKKEKTDYTLLRKLVLDSAINVGEITIKGAQVKDLQAKVKGQNGIFSMAPFSLNAYEGNVAGSVGLDVRGEAPAAQATVDIKGLQIRKLIYDFMKKDIIEGTAAASMNISMTGDSADLIKKTLSGKGDIRIKNGAIVGLDLEGMVNNIKTAFGKAQSEEKKDRTVFTEFIIPFEITNGIIDTKNTSLVSKALKVKATGNADLTKESLDFRIEPTYVSGKNDYTVPVLVKGTFKEPKFSPDLDGLLKKSLEKGIDKLLKGKTEKNSEESESTNDSVKGLLKGLFGK